MDKLRENRETIKSNCETLIRLQISFQNCKNSIKSDNNKGYIVYGMNDLIDDYRNMLKQCGEQRQALNDFLDSLSDQEIREVLSVMYAGRDFVVIGGEDRFIPYDEQYDYFKDHNKMSAKQSILEKEPLVEYLIHGMEYYSI